VVSIEKLTEKFGPSKDVKPWGSCLVVQGTEFDPDWEAELGDLGYRCHFGTLDQHAVTFVQLKKTVAPGKSVYVPPKPTDPAGAAAARVYWSAQEDDFLIELWKSNLTIEEINLRVTEKFPVRVGVAAKHRLTRLKSAGRIQNRNVSGNEVKEMMKKETENKPKFGNGCQAGPDWSEKEVALLLERWDVLEEVSKKDKAAALAKLPEFNGRSPQSIYQKYFKLQPKTSKEAKSIPETSKVDDCSKNAQGTLDACPENTPGILDKQLISAPVEPADPDANERIIDERKSEDAWSKTVEVTPKIKIEDADVLLDLVAKTQLFSEVYDSLSTAYVKLRMDFEDYAKLQSEIVEVHRRELTILTAKYAVLQKEISRHKHAVSGEAMLPLEAS
jgi:hypothetical protein